MSDELPPGPWERVGSNVLDANGHIVAMPTLEAVADLLLRAEREADPTPITCELIALYALRIPSHWRLLRRTHPAIELKEPQA